MKNFFSRIGRFFWSRGCLKFVLWTVTLIVLFYAEEDWRGARAWAATKAKWEKQGETFDILRLPFQHVPDEENLAALSLFKMERDPGSDSRSSHPMPLQLRKALTWDWDATELPTGGHWEWGQLANSDKNRALVAAAYRATFKNAPTDMDALSQFDALVPVIADLRAASSARPDCRFEQIDPSDLLDASFLSLTANQLILSKFLTADAILALDAKKPDIALADIVVQYKLLDATIHQPTLLAELVALGIQSIDQSAIYQGLATHAWNDQQLAQLQKQIALIDFLAGYQIGLRGEACVMVARYDLYKSQRDKLMAELNPPPDNSSKPPPWRNPTPFIWPNGWIDLLKSRSIDFHLTSLRLVDVQNRVISPEAINQLTLGVERKQNRWSIFPREVTWQLGSAVGKFAIAQVRLDETRLACALERYHLAHGAYPATLEELAPAYIDSIPHDIIDGKPYHYQGRADGTFQLYSVGWNQTDDGGNFTFMKNDPKAIDYKSGDWPWPTPK